MSRVLRVIDLSKTLLRYQQGLDIQATLVAQRKAGTVGDTLLLFQHHAVYTLGKRGSVSHFKRPTEELLAEGVEIVNVPRGGELTFHGPGQLIAYPIIGLRSASLGARAFVEGLEDAVVSAAAAFGISAQGRVPGATGVWVGQRKIAALGVQITHGVSSHGVALNVCTDLRYFDDIIPCGITDREVTSLSRECGPRVEVSSAAQALVRSLALQLRCAEAGQLQFASQQELASLVTASSSTHTDPTML
ncbi:MAG: hypothetical protein WDW38_001440 [Sanguina aurantia]